MGHGKLLALFSLFIFCFIQLTICQEEGCDFQTSQQRQYGEAKTEGLSMVKEAKEIKTDKQSRFVSDLAENHEDRFFHDATHFVLRLCSEPDNEEPVQPPAGCMSGSFVWHNPTDSVNLAFPRSLLPDGSRRRMKVCMRASSGAGVRDMFQLIGRGRRGRRPGELRLQTNILDEAETYPWSCSRPSRRGVRLVLYGVGDEEHEYVGLEYKVEEVEHSGRRPNRRPKKTRPDSSRPGPRPGRRPGGRPGGRRPNNGTPGRNRRPNRGRGSKNRFPVEEGEYTMRSYRGQEAQSPNAD